MSLGGAIREEDCRSAGVDWACRHTSADGGASPAAGRAQREARGTGHPVRRKLDRARRRGAEHQEVSHEAQAWWWVAGGGVSSPAARGAGRPAPRRNRGTDPHRCPRAAAATGPPSAVVAEREALFALSDISASFDEAFRAVVLAPPFMAGLSATRYGDGSLVHEASRCSQGFSRKIVERRVGQAGRCGFTLNHRPRRRQQTTARAGPPWCRDLRRHLVGRRGLGPPYLATWLAVETCSHSRRAGRGRKCGDFRDKLGSFGNGRIRPFSTTCASRYATTT